MSVNICELLYADGEDGRYFELTVKFTVTANELVHFKRFEHWVPICYVHDPVAHDAQVSLGRMVEQELPHSGYTQLKWEGPPVTDDWKHGFTRGLDCLSVADGVFTFHEFFANTPVTQALVAELRRFQTNPEHSTGSEFAPVSGQYFSILLECLNLHWD